MRSFFSRVPDLAAHPTAQKKGGYEALRISSSGYKMIRVLLRQRESVLISPEEGLSVVDLYTFEKGGDRSLASGAKRPAPDAGQVGEQPATVSRIIKGEIKRRVTLEVESALRGKARA